MLASLLLAGVLAGCAATPKIDWSTRVGNYTFDQAVSEFGPPDKQATLGDGTLVAEWLTRRGFRQVYPVGGYYYQSDPPGYYGWYYPPTYMDTSSPDYFLRLMFDANKNLTAWKRFAK